MNRFGALLVRILFYCCDRSVRSVLKMVKIPARIILDMEVIRLSR